MKFSYRPEIDGLRTLAVMLVILHHLGLNALSGGYVGVDVFFVISGYLITGILYSDIQNGSFSISRFYKRRVIRLAPAYFLVLFTTSLAALIFMLPAELLNYFKSVIYSTFFAANFFMWQEVGGYFGGNSDVVPLLHLWSLGVEEQFYIFWPLIFLGIYKIFGKRHLLLLASLGIILGVWVSEYGVQHYRAASYYLLPTRFFELMLGSLLVFVPRSKLSATLVGDLLGAIGFGLIIYSAFTFSTDSFFPGYLALVPTIGTALIIQFVRGGRGVLGRALSLAPIVYLGRISYPAYLWHWPIIAYLNINLININYLMGAAVLVLTLILSAATFQFVELPFRRINRRPAGFVVSVGYAAPAIVALALSGIAIANTGFPGRFPPALNLMSEAILSKSSQVRGRCNEGVVLAPLSEDKCILGVSDRPVDFLIVGDSHANHFTGMIDVMARQANLRGYDVTQSQTIFLPREYSRFYYQDDILVEHKNFQKRNRFLEELVALKSYKAVVLGGSFIGYYNGSDATIGIHGNQDQMSDKAFEDAMTSVVGSIFDAGSKVFIIKGNPILAGVSYECSLNNLRFNFNEVCSFDSKIHELNFEKWNVFLKELKLEFPAIIFIEPDQVICDQNNCVSEIDGVPLYLDSGHLNYMGSELIGRKYLERFGNPLEVLNQ